jgi:hypothetical protein
MAAAAPRNRLSSGVGLPASVCYIFRPLRNRKHDEGVRDQSEGAPEWISGSG